MVAFPLIYAVYTGVAEAARDIAVAAAAKRTQPETVEAVGQLDTELAATLIAHRSMVNSLEQAQPGPETTNKVFQHRALVARSAVKTVELALVAAGGAGFFESMHLRACVPRRPGRTLPSADRRPAAEARRPDGARPADRRLIFSKRRALERRTGAWGTSFQKSGSWPKNSLAPPFSRASRRSSDASICSRS